MESQPFSAFRRGQNHQADDVRQKLEARAQVLGNDSRANQATMDRQRRGSERRRNRHALSDRVFHEQPRRPTRLHPRGVI